MYLSNTITCVLNVIHLIFKNVHNLNVTFFFLNDNIKNTSNISMIV